MLKKKFSTISLSLSLQWKRSFFFGWVGECDDKKRLAIIFFFCIGLGKGQAWEAYFIYMVDSLTNVSLSDAEGQSGYLLISQKRFRQREEKRGLDKEKPHEPSFPFKHPMSPLSLILVTFHSFWGDPAFLLNLNIFVFFRICLIWMDSHSLDCPSSHAPWSITV